MWWKKNKWKVIVPVLILAVLAGAFWIGGDSPGARGWKISKTDTTAQTAQSSAQPAQSGQQESTAAQASAENNSAAAPAQPAPEKTQESAGTAEQSAESTAAQTAENPPETQPEATQEPTQESGQTQTGETPAAQQNAPEPAKEPEVQPQQPEVKPETQTEPQTPEPQSEAQNEPAPEPPPETQPEPQSEEPKETTCTISISCATILNNMSWCPPAKVGLVPADGWILTPTEVVFNEGESVFNVLSRVCKKNKIHMEFSNNPLYNSAYIEGINNLYQFDVGELSGWMYSVNGWFPNFGCSKYTVQDGDVICWVYTCDLGNDVGGGYAVQNG